MAYRVLTIDREFGSGGARIAQKIATWLGWRLLDGEFIAAIASAAQADPQVVSQYDERSNSLANRMAPRTLRRTINPINPVNPIEPIEPAAERSVFFDADRMTEITRKVVEEAHVKGDCVIVGRGAQCILQYKDDVYHAFVYAPFAERLHRLQLRLEPGANIEQRIRTVDQERAEFLLQRFGKNWVNPQLYNLMICSSENEDRTARVLLYAMTGQL
jgi:cytidylate kinase